MADIDWDAAINAGEFPCSGGERRILQLAAGNPVSLRDTVTGLDDHNTASAQGTGGNMTSAPALVTVNEIPAPGGSSS